MPTTKRLHLVIKGKVQGVSFRAFVAYNAQKLGVTGWVRNNEDGTVELMADGAEEKLRTLLEACRQGPRHAAVELVEEHWIEPQHPFEQFVVY